MTETHATSANRSIDREIAPGMPDLTELGRGFARLAAAWTQTSAHALFDTVTVVNTLAGEVVDSLVDNLTPASVRDNRRRTPDAIAAPVTDQVNASLNRAVQDLTSVISRSAEDFGKRVDKISTEVDSTIDTSRAAARSRASATKDTK